MGHVIYTPVHTERLDIEADVSADGEQTAPDVEPSNNPAIDDWPEAGLLPNWALYDTDEQLHRFETLAHRPDTLAMMYALTPSSQAGALFERGWIDDALDESLVLADLDRRHLPRGVVVIGVDPATASGPRASWFVALPILFVPSTSSMPERRIVLGIERHRGLSSIEAQGRLLQQLTAAWRAEWIACEAVAGYSYLATYARETLHLPVKAVVTTHADRGDVIALAEEFRRGLWSLPAGDAHSQRVLAPLVQELREHPEGSKDTLMAMTFARRVYYEAPKPKPPPRFAVIDL